MLSFTASNIIAMSIIVYLCLVAPSASGKIGYGSAGLSKYRTDASHTKPMKPAGIPQSAHDNGLNTSSTSTLKAAAVRRNRSRSRSTLRSTPLRKNTTNVRVGAGKTPTRSQAVTPTKRRRQNEQPTPEPTGDASTSTTVYVSGPNAFALLLPQNSGGGYPSISFPLAVIPLLAEMVSNAEEDGIAYCTDGSGCGNPFPDGFITGAAYSAAADGSYVQVGAAIRVIDRDERIYQRY